MNWKTLSRTGPPVPRRGHPDSPSRTHVQLVQPNPGSSDVDSRSLYYNSQRDVEIMRSGPLKSCGFYLIGEPEGGVRVWAWLLSFVHLHLRRCHRLLPLYCSSHGRLAFPLSLFLNLCLSLFSLVLLINLQSDVKFVWFCVFLMSPVTSGEVLERSLKPHQV